MAWAMHFDEAPKLLYFSKNGTGCGELYIDGESVTGIRKIQITAYTREACGAPDLLLELDLVRKPAKEEVK